MTAPPQRTTLRWQAAPAAMLGRIVGVLTDIDDTLTTGGAITPDALDALHRLAAAGLPVVAVTGRPAGWSAPFAAAWPVAAIVAENGAVALFRDAGPGRQVVIEFAQDAATRAANAARLEQVAGRVLREVPGATRSADSAGRITDLAIDHAEFAHLPQARIDAVVALMRGAGMQATVSSIHINGWYGSHDKWSGACWIVRRLYGRDLAAETERWVYVGDSANDQAMFKRFRSTSIGVANLHEHAGSLAVWPTYLASGARGAGFAEVVERLLAARAGNG
jgi:HAD superfamily hydrolase (TIGR01484 family)